MGLFTSTDRAAKELGLSTRHLRRIIKELDIAPSCLEGTSGMGSGWSSRKRFILTQADMDKLRTRLKQPT